ncbi:MAG: adenosine deaminase [Acidobacteriota bacterium]
MVATGTPAESPRTPLVELHRHLDGNVRVSTILDLGQRHGIALPADTVEGLRPHIELAEPKPDLLAFLARFELLRGILVDYDAVRRVVRENLEDAAAEGIDYIELRFSPYFMAEPHGLDPQGVVEAACDALKEARGQVEVQAKLIGIISRNYGTEIGWQELEACLAGRHRGLVALDLAGDEAGYPGELFVDHFRRAREAGLRTIAHAGEAAGPESVRQAVLGLEAERIGHGVRAIEDQATLALLVERGIPLEVCPTSNVHTSTFGSYAEHPLKQLLAAGIKATLNTDDPAISGIDLAHEFRIAEEELGLGPEELETLRRNAFEGAFLNAEERQALVNRPS